MGAGAGGAGLGCSSQEVVGQRATAPVSPNRPNTPRDLLSFICANGLLLRGLKCLVPSIHWGVTFF